MARIELQNLRKTFGQVVAVNDVSLQVENGEFVALLGPSGCGKTTTLRMVSGLETPDSGTIRIGDRDVTTPEHAAEMHRLISNSRLAIIPGGHGDYIGEMTTPQDSSNCSDSFIDK